MKWPYDWKMSFLLTQMVNCESSRKMIYFYFLSWWICMCRFNRLSSMKWINKHLKKSENFSLQNSINFVACFMSFTILMCTLNFVLAFSHTETTTDLLLQVNCSKCHPSASLLHWSCAEHYKFCGGMAMATTWYTLFAK